MAYSLREIIDVAELEELIRFFYDAVRVPVGILDAEHNWLVKIGWQRICSDFHRANPFSRQNCLASETEIQQHLECGEYISFRCPHGLQEVAFPIMLEGQNLGTFFMGQFLTQPADLDFFRRQALSFGYDIDAYLRALGEVPIVSEERIEDLMRFFSRFLGLLTRIGEENLRRCQAEQETRKAKAQLEEKVEERTRELNEALNEVGDLAIQLNSALYQVEQLAITDSLTQTYNRRKFDEVVQQERHRVKQGCRPFSVIMLDIDHFKKVNDRFGHSIGDSVLQHLCRLVRGAVRHSDLLIRWGGEEFLIMLPSTQLDEAVQMAERIRVETCQESFPQAGRLTVSLGVAQFHPEDSIDSLLKRADDSLYQAKLRGRNRVVTELELMPKK